MFDDKSVSFTVLRLLSYVGWSLVFVLSPMRATMWIFRQFQKNSKKKERENLLQFVWRNGWFFTGQWTRLFVLRCDFCCYWWVHFSNALCNNFHSVLPLFRFRCTNIVIVIAEMVSKIQINFFLGVSVYFILLLILLSWGFIYVGCFMVLNQLPNTLISYGINEANEIKTQIDQINFIHLVMKTNSSHKRTGVHAQWILCWTYVAQTSLATLANILRIRWIFFRKCDYVQ